MSKPQPHIIQEGNKQYSLGELKGSELIYDFDKMLVYLNAKGNLLFGETFKIFEEDRDILFKLCNYFIGDEANCKKFDIDVKKGILLSGPVGCGKTSLMKLLRFIVPHQNPIKLFRQET